MEKTLNQVVLSEGKTITRFAPLGYKDEHITIQELITAALHKRLQETGVITAREMGYLYCSTTMLSGDRMQIRLYFHPELATKKVMLPNGQIEFHPIPEFGLLNKYFYVSEPGQTDLSGIIGICRAEVQKSKIEFDELGRKALRVKENDSKYQEVVYLECNPSILIAYIMDIDLDDPYFNFASRPVGKITKKSPNAIVSDLAKKNHPTWIDVIQSTEGYTGYDPEKAIPYLINKIQQYQKSESMRMELREAVQDKSAKAKKAKKEKERKKKYKSAKYL